MKYQWKYKNTVSTNYYHDENGKIVGEITRVNFSDDIWVAEVNKEKLGEYIDNRTARKAVEDQVVWLRQCEGIFDMKQVSEDFNPRDDYNNGYSGDTDSVAKWETRKFYVAKGGNSFPSTSNNESQLGENH